MEVTVKNNEKTECARLVDYSGDLQGTEAILRTIEVAVFLFLSVITSDSDGLSLMKQSHLQSTSLQDCWAEMV